MQELNIKINDECHVDKFKIISELVEEVILLANYILNKIPHKYLDKTPYKL
jgi:hypothetical protein